ncbi:hypothetical protein V5T82_09105 [Magnetovibrio sp. PR-2]|uniref:hypothetical protein n=1 Tax=Magnetovibrio sp. PR-2 TaxID=3120356 RepID=UPI002FCE58BB
MIGKPWFVYTLDLLQTVIGTNAPIQFGSNPAPKGTCATIYYGVNPPSGDGLYVPCCPEIGDAQTKPIHFQCASSGDVKIPIYESSIDRASGEVDLFFNFFAYVSCLEEFEYERRRGPSHSYVRKFQKDKTRFLRPYAHFIGLALRERIAKEYPYTLRQIGTDAVLYLTHDIDVIRKTMRTRLKEGMFRVYASLKDRSLKSKWILRMFFGDADYFNIATISDLEDRYGVKSCFNVFVSRPPVDIFTRLKSMLFDPGYNLQREPELISVLQNLMNSGNEIGVHFAFDSWCEADCMRDEQILLAKMLAQPPRQSCRQHWLRFSFSKTWSSQWESGVKVDTSLCFNDLAGFRSGLAMAYHPFDHIRQRAHDIIVLPTIAMDTHFHYYQTLSEDDRRAAILTLLSDVKAVGGKAAIVWHTHTFSEDHGWGADYSYVLSLMKELDMRYGLPKDLIVEKAKDT